VATAAANRYAKAVFELANQEDQVEEWGRRLAGNAFIGGVARQPEAQGRMIPWLFTIVGLVEAMYFINLAFGFVFLSNVPAK